MPDFRPKKNVPNAKKPKNQPTQPQSVIRTWYYLMGFKSMSKSNTRVKNQQIYDKLDAFEEAMGEDVDELPVLNNASSQADILRYTAHAYVLEIKRISNAVVPADPTRSIGGRNPPEVCVTDLFRFINRKSENNK